jgi:hypothetical protein
MGMSRKELEKLAKSMSDFAAQSRIPAKVLDDFRRHMSHVAQLPLEQLSQSLAASAGVVAGDFAEKAGAALLQPIQEAAARIPDALIRPQRDALEAFTKALPRITFSYPDLAKQIQFSVPEIDRLRDLFQQFGSTLVREIAIDSDLLGALRARAWEAANEQSLDETDIGQRTRTSR